MTKTDLWRRNSSPRSVQAVPALKAQSKSSGTTEATLPGVLALVRLLARDAAREALADQANKLAARENGAGACRGSNTCRR